MRNTNKDAFYFPHDSNAKDDIKCMELIGDLGLEGYGIFWVLIETLREQADYRYPTRLLPLLARRYGSDGDTFRKVVYDYGLFVIEDDSVFFSQSLIRRMEAYDRKREQARNAGKASGEKRARTRPETNARSTDAQRMFNGCSTDDEPKRVKESRVKESRVKESRVKESRGDIRAPTLGELTAYIQQHSYAVDGERFFHYYESRGWQCVPDWRQKLEEWNDKDKLTKPPVGVKLGVGEFIKDGRRTYGTGAAMIPMSAPPRPSERYMWNAEQQNWMLL